MVNCIMKFFLNCKNVFVVIFIRCFIWIYGIVECSDCILKEREIKQSYYEKSKYENVFILSLDLWFDVFG